MNELRRRLIETLAELSIEAPDFRFGQLIANLSSEARVDDSGACYSVDDDELLAVAMATLWRYRQRNESTTSIIIENVK